MRVVLKKWGLEKAVVLGLVLACPYGAAAAADHEVGVNWSLENNQVINDDYDVTHAKSATAVSLGDCNDITINSKELQATVSGTNADIVKGLSVIRSNVTVADGISITTSIKSTSGGNLRASGVDLLGTNAKPSTIVFGKNTVIATEAQGGSNNRVEGIYNYDENDITLGDGSVVSAKNNSGYAYAILHDGNTSGTSKVSLGDNVALRAEITDGQVSPSLKNHASGLNNRKGDEVKAGNNLSIEASSTTHTDGVQVRVDAVNNLYGASIEVGDGLVITARVQGTTGAIQGFGVYNYQSEFKAGANAVISTSSSGNAANSNVDARGVVNQSNSKMTFGDNATITAQASDSGLAVAVLNQTDSVVNFEGGLYAKGTHFSLYSTDRAVTNLEAAGKDKVIIGDMYSNSGAKINAVLDTARSLFEGAAVIGAAGGDINFTMSNEALWKMTGDSSVTKLDLSGGAVVDMSQHGVYQQLDVAELSGSGGEFIMKTDLASETDGDKLYITDAAAGTSQLVQVADVSLSSGMVVTGEKKLLLITDASKNATFVGKKLNEGGLWDVMPTIENGLAVGGSEEEWYLTKLAKNVNNDTEVLLNASDNSYALWRSSNDTLRKRLGDLRYRSNQTDSDGIWVRYIGGKFGSGSFDGRYNMYQLGYDKAVDARSTYGIAVESGTGRGDYAAGSSKDKLWTGSLYGTWYGSNGTYTDVVARYGHFDTDINSYGDYPDKANNKNHAYSLSIEYGKTIELSEKRGTFIEPQAQFIMGRMSSSSYTTDRGNNVYLGGVNSYIGRLGIVAGQKMSDGNDVYFKANLLHEFGGDRDIYMRAANGETLSDSRDYGDTWFELGLGGNIRMGKNSSFYGDIERSFGADIQKKWQLNAGVRFEF